MTKPLSPDTRAVNHLAEERSEYLRQHRHNPIDWHPWGEEALALAKHLDRPIFLSIGYASCHWCHVMEREVFEREEVAAFMNEHFVSIKVDREERPDLDAVYMGPVQAMTGSGGWPLSAFLTPALQPFFGATYIPRDQFLELTARIERVWRTDKAALADQGRRVLASLEKSRSDRRDGAVDLAAVTGAVRHALQHADETWGGVRNRMKSPPRPAGEGTDADGLATVVAGRAASHTVLLRVGRADPGAAEAVPGARREARTRRSGPRVRLHLRELQAADERPRGAGASDPGRMGAVGSAGLERREAVRRPVVFLQELLLGQQGVVMSRLPVPELVPERSKIPVIAGLSLRAIEALRL